MCGRRPFHQPRLLVPLVVPAVPVVRNQSKTQEVTTVSKEAGPHAEGDASRGVPEGIGMPGTARAAMDRWIIAACTKPRTLAQLARESGVPKTTLHRRLQRLPLKTILRRAGDTYQAVRPSEDLEQGRAFLLEEVDGIRKLWQFISRLPTLEQQAFAELVILGVIARAHNLGHDSHPAFLLVGGTQLLKSTLCEMICIAVGADLMKCRVNMMQVRGRGLLVRLSPKGEVLWVSDALQEPIAWLEEVSMSAPETERDLYAFLHGSKDVKIENNIVKVSAVGLLEMNPIQREGSLVERIGMEAQRIRRMIVLDMDRVEISDAMRVKCREEFERMRSMKPVELPPPASGELNTELKALVLETFSLCIKPGPETRDLLDPSRVLVLIEAARSMLGDREACRQVLNAFFTVAVTTNLVVEDWPARLAAAFPLKSDSFQTNGPLPTTPQTAESLTERDPELTAILKACSDTSAPNPYTQASLEAQTVAILSELGLRLPEDAEIIRATLSASIGLAAHGVTPDALAATISRARELAPLDDYMRRQGLDVAALNRLALLEQTLRAHGISMEEVPAFFALHVEMGRLGLSPAFLGWFVHTVSEKIEEGKLPETVLEEWFQLAEEWASMRQVVDALSDEIIDGRENLNKLRHEMAQQDRTFQQGLKHAQTLLLKLEECSDRVRQKESTLRVLETKIESRKAELAQLCQT
jgi:hypothetical protein